MLCFAQTLAPGLVFTLYWRPCVHAHELPVLQLIMDNPLSLLTVLLAALCAFVCMCMCS